MLNILGKFYSEYEIIRFLIIGAINTVFGYLLFAALLFVGLHYSLATLFSTILAVLFNFKTTGKLVFKNHNNKLIFKFIGVYTLIYFLNITSIKIISLFGFNYYICGALTILPSATLSFILNKKIVFKS